MKSYIPFALPVLIFVGACGSEPPEPEEAPSTPADEVAPITWSTLDELAAA